MSCFRCFIILLVSMMSQSVISWAQKDILLYGHKAEEEFPVVIKILTDFEIFKLDAAALKENLESQRDDQKRVTFHIKDGIMWEAHLEPSEIFTPESKVYLRSERGTQPYTHMTPIKTFQGFVIDRKLSSIRLTLTDRFFYGFIQIDGEEWYIEPLKYFDHQADSALYVVYKKQDVVKTHQSGECFRPMKDDDSHTSHLISSARTAGSCYKTKLALLADYSMVSDPAHPGVDAVIDHLVGVMNNVQSNFNYAGSTNFDDGVVFEISEIVISTCATCDPLSGQTNAGNLLAEFSSWIDQNGFYHPFHAAHFWTNRDLDNTTVGVAFHSANLYCQSRARALFEDWTTTGALLKTMVSHEIGHTFNAGHDASNSGYILAPTININNTTWSPSSKTTISGQIAVQGPSCMAFCSGVSCPKVEDLVLANINNQNFTVSWSPSLQGYYNVKVREAGSGNFILDFNTSASSVVLSPSGYSICKKYDVFVYNNCSASGLSAVNRLLVIGPVTQGCADFSVNKTVAWPGASFSFTDKSLNATSWYWTFGNGQTSTSQNPIITYHTAGLYDVSLTVNGMHTVTYSTLVRILPDMPLPFTLTQGGNFESNPSYFSAQVIEGTTNVWEYGASSYVLSTQGSAWKSKLNSNIPQVTSKSALFTPRYNFSTYQNFTLSFDIGMQVAFCNAPVAVQLQYSTNNGNTWTRLGNAPSFYNAGAGASCKVAAQVFPDSTGWTLNSNYIQKSIDLSFLSGQTSVIFRFVVSISGIFNGGYNVDGVLIDNFRIDAFNPLVLPLDVQSLAGYVRDHKTFLTWSTTKPDEFADYTVWRSKDGITFEQIGNITPVKRNGYNFQYIDHEPLSGKNYYKISAKYPDGDVKFSNIIKINHQHNTTLTVVPNPIVIGQSFMIQSTNQDWEIEKIYLSDGFGRVTDLTGQCTSISCNTTSWNAGVYHLHIFGTDGSLQMRRIVIIDK